jgi:hypothetical protein
MNNCMKRVAVLLLALALVACSSWRGQQRQGRLRIDTRPPGATVWVQDAGGQHELGESPALLERDYQVQTYDFNPLMWLWAALSAGATVGGGVWLDQAPGSDDTQEALSISLLVLGSIATLVSVPGAIGGQLLDGEERVVYGQEKLLIGAELPGHSGARMEIDFPTERDGIELLLHAKGEAEPEAEPEAIGALAAAPSFRRAPVVAVFDLHDAAGLLDSAEREQLTAYLATRLAEARKGRVVPREQLRQRLTDQKREAHRPCYEERCQIALGKALAAEKSLSSTLMRVGERCALTLNLYDLESETAERGASVKADCRLEALLEAVERAVERL